MLELFDSNTGILVSLLVVFRVDINYIIISGNNVIFNMYYDDAKSNKLSFNADGFDIKYIEE